MSFGGFLYAIGAAIAWGLVYTIDQRILRNASPFALLFIDALFTVVILLPIVLLQKNSLSSLFGNSAVSGRIWIFIVVSLIFAALANFLIFSSIRILGASTASIFEIAYPFFVVIFSYFAFRSVPSVYFLLGAAFIFLGAIIIIKTG